MQKGGERDSKPTLGWRRPVAQAPHALWRRTESGLSRPPSEGLAPPLLLSAPAPPTRWVFLHEKAYQVRDTAIESSVVTKVKGYGRYANRVMDVSDYVTPPQVRPSAQPRTLWAPPCWGGWRGGAKARSASGIPRPDAVASGIWGTPSQQLGGAGGLGLPSDFARQHWASGSRVSPWLCNNLS